MTIAPDVAAGGPRLLEFLKGLPIDSRWQSGHRIVWQTGQRNSPTEEDPAHSTHCSAFVAAIALDLDLYVLRPPNHGQKLLSNAQVAWLSATQTFPGPAADDSGWSSLGSGGDAGVFDQAVAAAMAGKLVVAGYQNPDATRPGHLVIVLPIEPETEDEGPVVVSVGQFNHWAISMKQAFKVHHDAFPSGIKLFQCDTPLETDVP